MEKVPTSEEVIAARQRSQMLVEASKRGQKTFADAKAACEEYIALAVARQLAVFGKVKCRPRLAALLR